MNKTVEETIENILNRLQYIGERCIKIARENGDYNDITAIYAHQLDISCYITVPL